MQSLISFFNKYKIQFDKKDLSNFKYPLRYSCISSSLNYLSSTRKLINKKRIIYNNSSNKYQEEKTQFLFNKNICSIHKYY